MKVLFVAWMLALGNFSVDAFTSSSTSPRTAIRTSGFHDIRNYHHMGDLDHDELPEEDGHFFPNPTSLKEEAPEVVLYDNVAVALDDEAYDMAMKSVMALFVALAVAFAGPGIFRPRPVLAFEPMTFSIDDAPTVMVRSAASPNDSFRAPSSITSSSWMNEQK